MRTGPLLMSNLSRNSSYNCSPLVSVHPSWAYHGKHGRTTRDCRCNRPCPLTHRLSALAAAATRPRTPQQLGRLHPQSAEQGKGSPLVSNWQTEPRLLTSHNVALDCHAATRNHSPFKHARPAVPAAMRHCQPPIHWSKFRPANAHGPWFMKGDAQTDPFFSGVSATRAVERNDTQQRAKIAKPQHAPANAVEVIAHWHPLLGTRRE